MDRGESRHKYVPGGGLRDDGGVIAGASPVGANGIRA